MPFEYRFPSKAIVSCREASDRCYAYALAELGRLLGRVGIAVEFSPTQDSAGWFLAVSDAPTAPPPAENVFADGFVLSVKNGVFIRAAEPKGILNGVYELAERIGFIFLLPGTEYEWAPRTGDVRLTLAAATEKIEPRFKYRGVFFQQLKNTLDFDAADWLRYYAKLKFNAVRHEKEQAALCAELGLRLETGGHGFSELLPRELFDRDPDMFRMFQPEDFNGRRVADFNMCPTAPAAITTVKENFKRVIADHAGVHAVHVWADDLPAGGWCLCSRCRAFSPTDQAMLAMRHLGAAIVETGAALRLPVIAYHDTIFPGVNFDPPERGFLLFAPRERCYGHALDDAGCRRNRRYLDALAQWTAKFDGFDDAHTFEYYFDQILFRGFYPFLPDVIIRDADTYRRHGIECHLSLQVAGPEIAPEYNMLVFAAACWRAELTGERFIDELAEKILPEAPALLKTYLTRRAEIFQNAMRMCDYDFEIYFDYRWLPETTLDFGREMADVYAVAADTLDEIADALDTGAAGIRAENAARLLTVEAKRAHFEAAELRNMAIQQKAYNLFAEYLNTGHRTALAEGVRTLDDIQEGCRTARRLAQEAGLSPESWYVKNINGWIAGESARKCESYRKMLNTCGD